jgi:hypothetical protein
MRVEATPRVDIGALNALSKLLQVAQGCRPACKIDPV